MFHPRVSAVVIAKDEEASIARCLASLSWADEVVVVDTGSRDRTVQIAEGMGARTLKTQWRGFGLTKRFATEQATNDWVLSVDADEVVTPPLAEGIVRVLRGGPRAAAYRIQRRSFYLGSPIRFSGWQRDRPIRLFDRRRGTFNDRIVHEFVVVEGPVETLRCGLLLHYPYPTLDAHLAKMGRYAALGAQVLHDRGRTATIAGAVARAGAKFTKMYVLLGGFLDGRAGFLLAWNSSYGVFLKYATLWELSRRHRCT